ncbi:MAG TPA: saccharopine dehydrogenase C-terminal domain-containing protein [Patescibacteria group bacterium]|nr:saccharopine dehydrogenase C-terminal domain-containing protein [Patescibacteria group bacterium]
MATKKYLVVGTGKMGLAVAYDLLLNPDTAGVTVCDRDGAALAAAASVLHDPRVSGVMADAGDLDRMHRLMVGHDCAIGAASYDFNLSLTKAAIASRIHFCDLGGNNGVVEKQFMLDAAAKNAGIRVLPDCGIAPGAVSVLARHALDMVPAAERLQIRVGGLPQKPEGLLKYALAFSVRGLVNEYVEPAEILWEGKRELVPSLGGLEYQEFPEPFGRLEAAYTSGGSSTLARTYEGRVKYLDYKTLRWPGHWDVIRTMRGLGMFDETSRIDVGSICTPREFTERFLEKTLPKGVPDALVLRVAATDRERKGVVFDLIDLADPATGHSAMQRTTAYSASICARMLAYGIIADVGTLRHEVSIQPALFLDEWKKRGIDLLIRPAQPA